MQLLGNRIIVQAEKPIEKTSSGIYMPDNLQEPRNVGEVIMVGDKADKALMGKQIMFNKATAQNFDTPDLKGSMIFAVDIIAILN